MNGLPTQAIADCASGRRRDVGLVMTIPYVASTRAMPALDALRLKIEGDGGDYAFGFDAGQGWQWLAEKQDGTLLSTDVAGGFIGAVIGPHARTVPKKREGAGT